MVLVIKGQSTTHHLIHDHAETPPVYCSAIVIVLKNLENKQKKKVKSQQVNTAQ